MKIAINDLRNKITHTFSKKGFDKAATAQIVDYLLWAEMSGIDTQGLIKMTGTEPLQNIEPKYSPKIERETKLSQLIDGGSNPAPVVASIATDAVIAKAKENGFAIVGARNTFSSNEWRSGLLCREDRRQRSYRFCLQSFSGINRWIRKY
jgi:LDH2 family malate/lactate/ureidoglycolate dehydrogenase